MTSSLSGTIDQDNLSWQVNFIKNALQEGVLKVKFIKRDGTERDMRCTHRSDLIPINDTTGQKKSNDDSIAVWDVDKNAWRSFRFDSVIGFSQE